MKENRDATDTNVATIEKDIINAQHFIDSIKTDKEYKEENGWHGYYNKEIVELARILENILSDYQIALKENEHKTEKIENQKNELAILNDKQKDFNKLQNTLNSYKGQFRRQEKENKELKEKWDNDTHKLQNDLDIANAKIVGLLKENEELKYKYDKSLSDVIAGIDLDNSYIPVRKIKDKMEELNKEIKNVEVTEAIFKIKQQQVLQELIEEREENKNEIN